MTSRRSQGKGIQTIAARTARTSSTRYKESLAK
jgi:hypothetical protein